MISREKIAELILNNSKIYVRDIPNGINVPQLREYGALDFATLLISSMENQVYESKEDAEFDLKYKQISRSINLPSWEEIITDEKYKCFGFICFESNNIKIVVKLPNENDDYEHISIAYNDKLIDYWGKATKENYIKACEICRKLFLGEEIE